MGPNNNYCLLIPMLCQECTYICDTLVVNDVEENLTLIILPSELRKLLFYFEKDGPGGCPCDDSDSLQYNCCYTLDNSDPDCKDCILKSKPLKFEKYEDLVRRDSIDCIFPDFSKDPRPLPCIDTLFSGENIFKVIWQSNE